MISPKTRRANFKKWLKENKLSAQGFVTKVNDFHKATVIHYRTVIGWIHTGSLPRGSNQFFIRAVFPECPAVMS